MDIHNLQEATIPRWVFDPFEKFLNEIYRGDYRRFLNYVRREISDKYARGIRIRALSDPEGQLIDLGPPYEGSESEFVFIRTAYPVRVFLAERPKNTAYFLCVRTKKGRRRILQELPGNSLKIFLQAIRSRS